MPRYILFNTLGWVRLPPNSRAEIPRDGLVHFVFLLVQFIRSLPKEFDEAAIIDGCGQVGVFLRSLCRSRPPVW